MGARRCIHCSDELCDDDPTRDIITGETFCGANPDSDRHEPERCPECGGYGWTDIHHASTDAVIGGRPCSRLDDPEWHPPATPVPLQIQDVPGHHPDCDGTCNHEHPDGCPPF